MNAQRRYLVLGLVGTALAGFLFFKLFLGPWQEEDRKLEAADKEFKDKDNELRAFQRERRKLERYRLLGLPANINHGGSEYAKYLKTLLQTSGLTVDDLQGPSGTEAKTTTQQQAKKPGHVVLTYQVRAHGDWPSLVTMMEKFQRTALLHRIRNFTLDRPAGSASGDKKLALSMTVEALVVHRNDRRPSELWGIDPKVVAMDTLAALAGEPTGWSMLLRGQVLLTPEMPQRDYRDLARLNPFVGAVPPPAPPVVVKKEAPPPPELDVRQYVELVMVNVADQKASLRNLLMKIGEQRRAYITLSPKFPYNVFQILDEDQEEVLVRGKVLRVDHRDVYFQVGESIYGMHVGQNLAEAMRRPLSVSALEELGIEHKTKTEEKPVKKGKG